MFVFGIDALQALELAMQFATVTPETSGADLERLGGRGALGLPKFLPSLPKAQQHRLERVIECEVTRLYATASRRAARKKADRRP